MRLINLLKRPNEEIALLLSVFTLVWRIRLGLWILPFPTLRKLVARAVIKGVKRVGKQPPKDQFCIAQLKWAVQAASSYVPQATCLTQAFTMQILMSRYGYESLVHIGVAKAGEKFEAHAWVESQGTVIIGGRGVERWTPLTTLEVKRP